MRGTALAVHCTFAEHVQVELRATQHPPKLSTPGNVRPPSPQKSYLLTGNSRISALEESLSMYQAWALQVSSVLNNLQLEQEGMSPLQGHFGIVLDPQARRNSKAPAWRISATPLLQDQQPIL